MVSTGLRFFHTQLGHGDPTNQCTVQSSKIDPATRKFPGRGAEGSPRNGAYDMPPLEMPPGRDGARVCGALGKIGLSCGAPSATSIEQSAMGEEAHYRTESLANLKHFHGTRWTIRTASRERRRCCVLRWRRGQHIDHELRQVLASGSGSAPCKRCARMVCRKQGEEKHGLLADHAISSDQQWGWTLE